MWLSERIFQLDCFVIEKLYFITDLCKEVLQAARQMKNSHDFLAFTNIRLPNKYNNTKFAKLAPEILAMPIHHCKVSPNTNTLEEDVIAERTGKEVS